MNMNESIEFKKLLIGVFHKIRKGDPYRIKQFLSWTFCGCPTISGPKSGFRGLSNVHKVG